MRYVPYGMFCGEFVEVCEKYSGARMLTRPQSEIFWSGRILVRGWKNLSCSEILDTDKIIDPWGVAKSITSILCKVDPLASDWVSISSGPQGISSLKNPDRR